jgi:gluconokinase
MNDYVIGIDIGTGSVKGLAVNRKGTVISSSQFSYGMTQTDDGLCEQNAEEIWKAFVNCVRSLRKNFEKDPEAIALSSAMHSLIAVDANDKPLSNVITWADNRAADVAERILHSSSGEMLYEQTGTPIHAMSPLCKIIWLRENNSHLFSSTSRFISIKEFVWFKLFQVYEADYSIASATGLFDIDSLVWNQNALEIAGLTKEKLSEVVDTDHHRTNINKRIAEHLGILNTTKILIGGSDGCMANLGSFATDPHIAALTIGTSGAIRVATKKPVLNFEAMTFNYRLNKHTFISGGPTNNGGVVLKWYAESFLKKKLQSAEDYSHLLGTIAANPERTDLLFLPYILGERAPIWNSDASGVFFGIRNHHTQEHFTKAVLEGVSMALYNIYENMERAGIQLDQINVSGGFVHSTEWLQIIANIFGKKLMLINTSDASALGAAYLALKTFGMITDHESLKPTDAKVIIPEANGSEFYKSKYQRFLKVYKSLQPVMNGK